MQRKHIGAPRSLDYLKHPEKGFPRRIWWNVVAPIGYKLSFAQESDLIYDDYDLKIRKLT